MFVHPGATRRAHARAAHWCCTGSPAARRWMPSRTNCSPMRIPTTRSTSCSVRPTRCGSTTACVGVDARTWCARDQQWLTIRGMAQDAARARRLCRRARAGRVQQRRALAHRPRCVACRRYCLARHRRAERDPALPDTGVPKEIERRLSSVFIPHGDHGFGHYGTVSTTLLDWTPNGGSIQEWNWRRGPDTTPTVLRW